MCPVLACLKYHPAYSHLLLDFTVNVDQDVDEPWPLEVYGHDGKATNVTMEPGDMILYESHSVIHGRPFPLKGRYFANVFVHFEPIGSLDPNAESWYDPKLDLPPYLIPGSKWEADWRSKNSDGWKGVRLGHWGGVVGTVYCRSSIIRADNADFKRILSSSTFLLFVLAKHYMDARTAARKGDLTALKRLAKANPTAFSTPDDMGWTPFHEAIRVGNKECIETILYAPGSGQHLNRLTYTGVTPLNIAREFLGNDHEVTQFLVNMGAVDKHPNRKGAERDEL